MASATANFLMQYGPQLAQTVKTNRKLALDEESEKLRQAMLQGNIKEQDLINSMRKQQVETGISEGERAKQAREAMARAVERMRVQQQPTEEPIQQDWKAPMLLPEDMPKPEPKKQLSAREIAIEEGLPQFGGQADVKEFTSSYIEKPEALEVAKGKLGGGIGAATAQKREDWNKIAAMEDGPDKDQAIDDYMMVYAPGTKYPLSTKGLNEKVNAKYAEIAPEAAKTSAVTTAKETAPARLSDKDVNDLTGQQNVYSTLNDVKGKFENKYVTPYIGKGIKMAYLKQTDPNFADFQSSLALGLNEYRRQNFGTAQTQTEIQNFLDVINSELNVSPEVFKKQLDSVLKTMERDYKNTIKVKSEQKYIIPESLKNAGIVTEEKKPSGIKKFKIVSVE